MPLGQRALAKGRGPRQQRLLLPAVAARARAAARLLARRRRLRRGAAEERRACCAADVVFLVAPRGAAMAKQLCQLAAARRMLVLMLVLVLRRRRLGGELRRALTHPIWLRLPAALGGGRCGGAVLHGGGAVLRGGGVFGKGVVVGVVCGGTQWGLQRREWAGQGDCCEWRVKRTTEASGLQPLQEGSNQAPTAEQSLVSRTVLP